MSGCADFLKFNCAESHYECVAMGVAVSCDCPCAKNVYEFTVVISALCSLSRHGTLSSQTMKGETGIGRGGGCYSPWKVERGLVEQYLGFLQTRRLCIMYVLEAANSLCFAMLRYASLCFALFQAIGHLEAEKGCLELYPQGAKAPLKVPVPAAQRFRACSSFRATHLVSICQGS